MSNWSLDFAPLPPQKFGDSLILVIFHLFIIYQNLASFGLFQAELCDRKTSPNPPPLVTEGSKSVGLTQFHMKKLKKVNWILHLMFDSSRMGCSWQIPMFKHHTGRLKRYLYKTFKSGLFITLNYNYDF